MERMKRLNFTNKKLLEKNETRAYFNNVGKAMLKYYQVSESQLSDFYSL